MEFIMSDFENQETQMYITKLSDILPKELIGNGYREEAVLKAATDYIRLLEEMVQEAIKLNTENDF
jgi:hypothetical protein